MMSIFASPFCAPSYTTEPSLVPLFRLLDDFDNYSREVEAAQPQPKRPRQSRPTPVPTFKPKFDVRETESTYELHGELPGIERENLHIEFTEPQTIVIRGRVERTKEQQPEPAHEPVAEPEPEKTIAANHNNHHATVEDDPEEEASSTASWTPVASPKPENAQPTEKPETAVRKQSAPKKQELAAKKNANAAGKIWLWERSIGEFSRTFSFPTAVEQDGVTANLSNGVLTVTVPKRRQHTPRRIAIL